MKTQFQKLMAFSAIISLSITGCQKLERPAAGDYPKDTNPAGGPLNFYVAFDGTTSNPAMNAVDSIRANFASSNPLKSIDGVSGKAVMGENKKFVKYAKPNDWAIASKSFSISVWFKKDGQTRNNTGTNGPEYLLSFPSSNGHWSQSNLLFFLEGNNTACAVKTMVVDAKMADNWMTWEGGGSIPGLCDNKWHLMTAVYDAATSTMTLYVDAVANTNKKPWTAHGNINIDNSKISELRVGAGPQNNIDTDDWLSSTFKGGIDQLRMYSKALTPAEIQSLFNNKQ